MTAWLDDEYPRLFSNAGLTVVQRPDNTEWPVSETFEGKLFALLTEKSKSPEGSHLNMQFKKGIN